jgi:hypothetical protein
VWVSWFLGVFCVKCTEVRVSWFLGAPCGMCTEMRVSWLLGAFCGKCTVGALCGKCIVVWKSWLFVAHPVRSAPHIRVEWYHEHVGMCRAPLSGRDRPCIGVHSVGSAFPRMCWVVSSSRRDVHAAAPLAQPTKHWVHSGDVHAATTLRATNHALGALCGDVHECFTPYVLCATMLWVHSWGCACRHHLERNQPYIWVHSVGSAFPRSAWHHDVVGALVGMCMPPLLYAQPTMH